MENENTITTLPKLDDLSKAAQYVADCAIVLRENGSKIVADLEAIEESILMEANSIKQEAESRSAALFDRAQQVRKMIEYHVGSQVNALPELTAIKAAA